MNTNWVRQCNTQVKARLLLGIKLRLPFLKAVNIINWQEIVMCLFTLLFAIIMVF